MTRQEPAYVLIRDVTKEECFWLDTEFKTGDVVYAYWGATYGCVGDGIAVTRERGIAPFNELPRDAVERIS
ncbi:hypothetical protein PHIN3_23 [Sinorhizobium phage phiN3]|uniref:Uncharacterized protein n=1 Tax=Sinorhizobium phage phiN3 TaxID=1647405 RepID=A0A0F6SIZ0_9CAUD|nr:hypothetical protein AVT40_gp023 [Sinorhizobium phage phiN3]AKF13288.1 hypothetical protein PHIN3_23 [Sinorhizobium phage phiN3]